MTIERITNQARRNNPRCSVQTNRIITKTVVIVWFQQLARFQLKQNRVLHSLTNGMTTLLIVVGLDETIPFILILIVLVEYSFIFVIMRSGSWIAQFFVGMKGIMTARSVALITGPNVHRAHKVWA